MEHTPETVTTRSNAMTKWGVRLIGIYFFLWAISDSYQLLSGIKEAKYFFGFYISMDSAKLAFMAWAQVVVLALIGFQLLRFQPSGRFWALLVLWMTALEAGVVLVWMTVRVVQDPYRGEMMTFHASTWLGELNGPMTFLLILFLAFLTFFIQAYFLTKKKVKQLFQKTVTTGETNPSPVDSKEQSL